MVSWELIDRISIGEDQDTISDVHSDILEIESELLDERSDVLEADELEEISGEQWTNIDDLTSSLSLRREQLYRRLAVKARVYQVYSFLILVFAGIFLVANVAGIDTGVFWYLYGGILSTVLVATSVLSYRRLYSTVYLTPERLDESHEVDNRGGQ
ncbi:hypothetical protein [Natronococcus wangiae]|uniref:hypothetical protein n=1 Tax=Natronococcus wangiae TaxID=3068275 RepID=UPI00273D434B|nr:hypothetical protein [Natronococcus sp. AD5]